MRPRNVTLKLLEAVKKLPQNALMSRRTWRSLTQPPETLNRVISRGVTGTTAVLPDGTMSYMLTQDPWPDIPYVKLKTDASQRIWFIPPWTHYDTAGQPRLAIINSGVPVLRQEILIGSEFQVPILVAKMKPNGEWADTLNPQWRLGLESDPYDNYPPPLEDENVERVLAVITPGSTQPQAPLRFARF